MTVILKRRTVCLDVWMKPILWYGASSRQPMRKQWQASSRILAWEGVRTASPLNREIREISHKWEQRRKKKKGKREKGVRSFLFENNWPPSRVTY